jgi:acyl dehydratase
VIADAAAVTPAETLVDGPYFEDLHLGQQFDDSPGLTLTEGLAAAHQAIVGGRLPLALDRELSRRVIGEGGPSPPPISSGTSPSASRPP